eukprot:TRINITY_DN24317_c0_g1_i1.p1 TRINITY_DN24317_c0_g1~~TRINITY_DN24317_c0_g1_i1.p1  ORF type:complete len:536 (-),score=84.12 TRINITY_DN24317_c0_g1_i1:292-1899(-)
MIDYDEGSWGCLFAFRIRGSVLPRALAWALPCSLLSGVLQNQIRETGGVWNEILSDISGDVLRGFTFVLGFLIVFRTQKAYSRWWEGGTLLQQLRGEWFNAVSNLIAFCNAAPEKRYEVERFQHQVVRLFSLLYGSALGQVSTMKDKSFEFIDMDGFDPDHMEYLSHAHDECELVVQWLQRLIVEANTQDLVKIAPPILSRVYNQLGNGIVKLNNARKIKEFPIPFPLAQMITIMLWIHWLTTALVCAMSLSSAWMASVVSFVVIVSFQGINYMSVELENPYGDDENDLPLHSMQRDMNRSLISLLHSKALKPPTFVWEPEEARKMKTDRFSLEAYVAQLRRQISEMPTKPKSPEEPLHLSVDLKASAPQTPASQPSAEPEVENCLDGICNEGGALVGNGADSSYGDAKALQEAIIRDRILQESSQRSSELGRVLENTQMAPQVSLQVATLHGAPPPAAAASSARNLSQASGATAGGEATFPRVAVEREALGGPAVSVSGVLPTSALSTMAPACRPPAPPSPFSDLTGQRDPLPL